MTTKISITQEIIRYVIDHPGTTSQDIFDALPHVDKVNTIRVTLRRLEREGVLINRGGSVNRWNPAQWYYNEPTSSERAQELARDILAKMAGMHHSVREQFLAEKLEELIQEKS